MIIEPEIIHDELWDLIRKYASRPDLTRFVEIGSSDGRGSTSAFIAGMKPGDRLDCWEIDPERYNALMARYPHVIGHNASTVEVIELPTAEDVTYFRQKITSSMSQYPLSQVLAWLEKDIEATRNSQTIRPWRADIALVDGSEFTGLQDTVSVLGSKIIILDDAYSYKNWESARLIFGHHAYELVRKANLRNGFLVFERKY